MTNEADADLDFWLAKWASWMRWNGGELPQGAPSVAAGFDQTPSNYAVAESDAEDYWAAVMVPCVISALDAAIDSLEPPQRRAIWWRYALTRIEPDDAPRAFMDACGKLRVLVLRRVAIAG